MKNIPYYHTMKGYNYLKPNQALINRAKRNLLKVYKNYVKKKEKGTRQFYYRYQTIRNKRVIWFEFVLHIKHRATYRPDTAVFEFTQAFDFKMEKCLMTEKKVYYSIAGWVYKPAYDYMIYPFTWKKHQGGSFKYPSVVHRSKSYNNIKISEYLKVPYKRLSFWASDLQKILNKDPDKIEYLYKAGFRNLLRYKMSKTKLNFLKKRGKHLKKDIRVQELNSLIRIDKLFNQKKNTKELIYIHEMLSKNSINTVKMTKKEMARIYNLHKAGHNLKELQKACDDLKLDFRKEIFKSTKRRKAIISDLKERERIIEERRRQNIKNINNKKYEEAKKKQLPKTLESITKNFNHIKVKEISFKPLKTLKDFVKISDELELCLMQNEYYERVKKRNSLIYIAIPKGKELKDSEVIEFSIKGEKIKPIQIAGIKNTKTDKHDTIKMLAEELKYHDLIGGTNV